MPPTFGGDRAIRANGLRRTVALLPRGGTFPVRLEEQRRIFAAAASRQLPVPVLCMPGHGGVVALQEQALIGRELIFGRRFEVHCWSRGESDIAPAVSD